MRAIRCSLDVGITWEERVIRNSAIELLEAAQLRCGFLSLGDLSLAERFADRITRRDKS